MESPNPPKQRRTKKTDKSTDAGAPGRVVPVRFDYYDREAQKVSLAGTFNQWKAEGLEMISLGGGKWAKQLLLPPGTYEYCFVVDGRWTPDPNARDSIPNPFGGVNSLRVVAPEVTSAASCAPESS